MHFWKSEDGTVTVEAVLWISFLVGVGAVVGEQIVSPLIANAVAQAQLNADSLALIEAAMSVCTGGT